MTEAEWLACDSPGAMLESLGSRASERQLRLFACACVRRVWHLLSDERSRTSVEMAERVADGLAGDGQRSEAAEAAVEAYLEGLSSRPAPADSAVLAAIRVSSAERAYVAAAADSAAHAVGGPERLAHCLLLRDIFGNPFRHASVYPAWQTPTVASLAQAAYGERALPLGKIDPSRLAVLADALEEAGCTDPDLLGHLRAPGPHVRGCWALDLVLGKE